MNDDMHDAHELARALPGATVHRSPSKRGMRSVRKTFDDVQPGDMHTYGRVASIEHDPHPRGRRGWVVFDDGTRSAESATVEVWVADPHGRNAQ